MNKIIYNIKYKAISLLLVLLSCSCTGIHPASSSSTGTPVTEVDTSTFFVRKAIDGEVLFKFTPGTSYAEIHAEVAKQKGTLWPSVRLVSFDKVVENSKTSQAHPTGDVSYVLLSDINLQYLQPLELKLAQLDLLELFLEKCNPKFNEVSLLDMFKVFRENQDSITEVLKRDQYREQNDPANPVCAGNQYSNGYITEGKSTLGVSFKIHNKSVYISVETTPEETKINYCAPVDYPLAHFNKVDGVLRMEIPPKHEYVPLEFEYDGDTT